jgi:hypothetical protein
MLLLLLLLLDMLMPARLAALDVRWLQLSAIVMLDIVDAIRSRYRDQAVDTLTVPPSVSLFPCGCTIRAVLFQCEPMWRLRQPVSTVHGVSMAAINRLHASAWSSGMQYIHPIELPLYGSDILMLSGAVDLLNIDFNAALHRADSDAISLSACADLVVTTAGVCHGALLFVDWSGGPDTPPLSTMPVAPSSLCTSLFIAGAVLVSHPAHAEADTVYNISCDTHDSADGDTVLRASVSLH